MAGHSKFKNIMHRKGAQDKKRAKLFSRLIREISVAAKIGGGDPDSNPRLRTAINNALSSNMAKDNIQKAIKKNTGNQDNEQIFEITYEGFGPSGVAIIVESLTNNKNRSASEVRSTFSKYSGNLGINGCVRHNFDKIGVITYNREVDKFENFFDYCASLDAHDITENLENYEVISSLESYHQMILNLEKKYALPKFASIEWRAINTIDIDQEHEALKLITLIEKLEDLEDVQTVVSNVNIDEKMLDKLF